jgi:hypothetical protein
VEGYATGGGGVDSLGLGLDGGEVGDCVEVGLPVWVDVGLAVVCVEVGLVVLLVGLGLLVLGEGLPEPEPNSELSNDVCAG